MEYINWSGCSIVHHQLPTLSFLHTFVYLSTHLSINQPFIVSFKKNCFDFLQSLVKPLTWCLLCPWWFLPWTAGEVAHLWRHHFSSLSSLFFFFPFSQNGLLNQQHYQSAIASSPEDHLASEFLIKIAAGRSKCSRCATHLHSYLYLFSYLPFSLSLENQMFSHSNESLPSALILHPIPSFSVPLRPSCIRDPSPPGLPPHRFTAVPDCLTFIK